jgi:hypothetical protein
MKYLLILFLFIISCKNKEDNSLIIPPNFSEMPKDIKSSNKNNN